KVNAAGTAVLWSAVLGGSGDDRGFGIAVDASGSAYVTGLTSSTNFPTTAGVLQRNFGGGTYDRLVAKVNPAGNGLAYSTYLGGSGDENNAGIHGYNLATIAVDGQGRAWVTGMTTSSNFPTTANAAQTSAHGSWDAFVTRLNATGSAADYSTY